MFCHLCLKSTLHDGINTQIAQSGASAKKFFTPPLSCLFTLASEYAVAVTQSEVSFPVL